MMVWVLCFLFTFSNLFSQDIIAKKERELHYPKKVLVVAINKYLQKQKQSKTKSGTAAFTKKVPATSSDDIYGDITHLIILKLQATGKDQCLLTVSCVSDCEKFKTLSETVGVARLAEVMHDLAEPICDEVMSAIIDKID